MSTQIRPTGVTILAILAIASGIYSIVELTFSLTSVIDRIEFTTITESAIAILVIFTFVQVVIGFVMASALLKGKSWAWNATIIYAAFSLILGLYSIDHVNIIIHAVLVYYLFRPNVRVYFGKSKYMLWS